MSYQQIREILDAIRKFHQQLRRELENAFPHADDVRSKTLRRSIRRAEKEIEFALARDKGEGSLEAWIPYVPSEELEDLMLTGHLPEHASPEEMLKWKQKVDDALATFYRRLGEHVSDPKIQELLESLAFGVEQRLLNQGGRVAESV